MKRCALAVPVVVVTFGCALASPTAAEERATAVPEVEAVPKAGPAQDPTGSGPALELVRVRIVLARQQGDKKTASIPYTLVVSTNGRKEHLRMGVEVPIAVGTSVNYRDVGTNIDCSARVAAGDRYEIELRVENSSVYRGAQEGGDGRQAAIVGDKPMFRSFAVQLSFVMRDGQTLQAVASTDPVTGEVVRIDVTLNVVK